jgi:ribonuclease BN (tRNA processing enzyme)
MNARLILYLVLSAVMVVSWLSSCVIYRAAELGELLGPIEKRSFRELTVVVIGSGGGYENPERFGPSLAIGWDTNVLLVDVGRGVAEGLRRTGVPLAQPRTILLSSLMPENTVGLDDLLLTGWRQPRSQGLKVIGPRGTAELVAGLLAAHRIGIQAEIEGLGLPPAGAEIEAIEIETGWSHDFDGLKVTAGALPGGPTPAFVWRIEKDDRTLAIAGHGWAPDAVVSFAKGADTLVHEAVIVPDAEGAEAAGVLVDPELLRKEAALHTLLENVGEVAKRSRVANLVLVRMRPPPFYDFQVEGFVGKSFDGSVIIPIDGEEFEP